MKNLEQDLRYGLLEEETLAEEPKKIDHKAKFRFHDKVASEHLISRLIGAERRALSPMELEHRLDVSDKHYALAKRHRRAHFKHTGEVLKSKNFTYLPQY